MAPTFGIVAMAKAATWLMESGFLTNPAEERYPNDKANQSYRTAGIYRTFRAYKRELEGG